MRCLGSVIFIYFVETGCLYSVSRFLHDDIQHLEDNVSCFPVSLVEKESKSLRVSAKIIVSESQIIITIHH